MRVIEWNDSLVVDGGVVDRTHREFVDLLNRLAEVHEADVVPLIDEFIAHCEVHFAQESRWMEDLSYGAAQCHRDEHDTVLTTAREVRRRVASGEGGIELVQFLAAAIAQWFENHAASMDTVLSLYMKEHGYAATAGA